MLAALEYRPVHQEKIIVFVVDSFYGSVEMLEMTCDISYIMINAQSGSPVPNSINYDGQEDIPFDTPLVYRDGKLCVATDKEIEDRKYHKDDEQRFWWSKDYALVSDRRYFDTYDLKRSVLGVMPLKQFIQTISDANIAVRMGNENIVE